MLGFKCANGSQDTLLKQVTYSEAERIWDRPESLPRQNNAIPYKPYGVAINTERVAKVERLDTQNISRI